MKTEEAGITVKEYHEKYPPGWVNLPDENGRRLFSVECKSSIGIPQVCGGLVYSFRIAEEDYARMGTANIQDVFPYLTEGQRELMLTNTCDICWDSLMDPDLEEE